MDAYNRWVEFTLTPPKGGDVHVKGFWIATTECLHCKQPISPGTAAFALGPPWLGLLHDHCKHLFSYRPEYPHNMPLVHFVQQPN